MLHKFLQLTTKDIKSIARNEQVYEAYLDWLMLLQDLVSPLAPTRSHHFFDKDVEVRLQRSVGEIPLEYQTVREKVEENTRTAMGLINQKVDSPEAANEIARYAEEFLDDIAESYSVLRNSRKLLRV